MHTITITSASMLSDEDGVIDRRDSRRRNSKEGERRGGDPVRAEEHGHTDEKKNADRKTGATKKTKRKTNRRTCERTQARAERPL